MNRVICGAILIASLSVACSTPYDKAVAHYAQSEADSLKYRAALFLRDHAEYHYGVERYLVDSTGAPPTERPNPLDFEHGSALCDYLYSAGYRFVEGEAEMDLDVITKEYLIDNIERAFEVWREPWAAEISFNDFCRYILPYRNMDESLTEWRARFMERYLQEIKDSLPEGSSYVDVAEYLMHRLSGELGFTQVLNDFYIDYMTPEESEAMHYLECRALAHYGTLVLRACGVPCAMILTRWRFSSYQHASIYLPAVGREERFYRLSVFDELQEMGLPKDTMASYCTTLYCYEVNEEFLALLKEGIVPRSLLLPITQRDITGEFSTILDFTPDQSPIGNPRPGGASATKGNLEITAELAEEPYLYLMRFNYWQWFPIRYGRVTDGRVTFKNTTIHQLYSYGKMNKVTGEVEPFGTPFTIDGNGTIFEYRSDGDTVTIALAYNCEESERCPMRRITSNYWTEKGWKPITVDAPLWVVTEDLTDYQLYSPELLERGYKPAFHLASFRLPAWSVLYDNDLDRPRGYHPTDIPEENYMKF